ncbi:MAG: hypothetical protein ACK2T2_07620 [Anaerolineales bacterium]
MSNLHPLPSHSPAERRLQRGQAMVLIALAFIGLAAFTGLTVDAGILFIQIGHLRRAVDSASLAAANQFREGRSDAEIERAADEFINLNSLNPAHADIFKCDISDPTDTNTNPYHDITLCPPDTNGDGVHNDSPPRKYVRVVATMPVDFAFLPIIGFGSIDIQANAVSEAASVDIVLAIDTSESMAYDADCLDGDDDDGDGVDDDCDPSQYGWPGSPGPTTDPSWDVPDDYFRNPDICNDVDPSAPGIQGACHPFEEVRDAALALVNRMYFPYDRMGIISFDLNAVAQLNLSSNASSITSAIGSLTVYKLPGCPGWTAAKNPTGCTSTNIADGLKVGGSQFGSFLREEAVLIFILLSDGSANAATDVHGNLICPGGTNIPTWVQPFCRDEDFEVGLGAYGYDAEDAAVDQAYFVGCPEGNSFDPSLTTCASPGQGAVVFTIGLGDDLIDNQGCSPSAYPGGCEVDQGEKLLRFIAAVGDDGDPSSDPCSSTATGHSCGNYYFSPTGGGLLQVFEAIASRIFTRIIH